VNTKQRLREHHSELLRLQRHAVVSNGHQRHQRQLDHQPLPVPDQIFSQAVNISGATTVLNVPYDSNDMFVSLQREVSKRIGPELRSDRGYNNSTRNGLVLGVCRTTSGRRRIWW